MSLGLNTATFLTKQAQQRPDALAVRYAERTLTYAQLSERALRFARALGELGLQRGDRVAIVQHNCPEFLETLYGVLAAGMIAVPINMRLHPKEIVHIVNDAGARLLVHSEEFNVPLGDVAADMSLLARISTKPGVDEIDYETFVTGADPLPQAVEVGADETAWLCYTSGTTGKPKGVMWTHRTIRVLVMNYLSDVYNMQTEDVVLHCAALSHGSGVVALAAIAKGAANVISDSPAFIPDDIFRTIEHHRVTNIAFVVPTQIVKLVSEFDAARDLSSLQCVCYGGAPMYVEDLKAALDAFGPVFVQIFGQVEAPLTITYLRREEHETWRAERPDRLGSAGIARTDVEVRVVNDDDEDLPAGTVGEIVCRGDVVMTGYWNNPEATEETLRNGWLHTGDLGMLDENGYLYILDRSKDMIVSGGHNIFPRELEEVILTIPDVVECAVIGIPDDYWGEAVHALVVMKDGAMLTNDDVIACCASNLARYKKPRSVEFLDELPKSSYGKILKRELRERYWQGHDRRVGGGVKV